MPGHVKGVLFADHVRMLRAHRGRTWHEFLEPEDLAFLEQTIDPEAWYPMESFERLGVARRPADHHRLFLAARGGGAARPPDAGPGKRRYPLSSGAVAPATAPPRRPP